jgi:hypothetical protein
MDRRFRDSRSRWATFIRSTPYADDVDGDGYMNLVLSGWDKNLYVWT